MRARRSRVLDKRVARAENRQQHPEDAFVRRLLCASVMLCDLEKSGRMAFRPEDMQLLPPVTSISPILLLIGHVCKVCRSSSSAGLPVPFPLHTTERFEISPQFHGFCLSNFRRTFGEETSSVDHFAAVPSLIVRCEHYFPTAAMATPTTNFNCD